MVSLSPTTEQREGDRIPQQEAEDEKRMSSRPCRTSQSRVRLRENPRPYPGFLIHEIATARNALRKTNTQNLEN